MCLYYDTIRRTITCMLCGTTCQRISGKKCIGSSSNSTSNNRKIISKKKLLAIEEGTRERERTVTEGGGENKRKKKSTACIVRNHSCYTSIATGSSVERNFLLHFSSTRLIIHIISITSILYCTVV